MASAKQKKYLAKLQKEDPEFYATIMASKDLMKGSASDAEDSDGDDDDASDAVSASDNSASEPDDDDDDDQDDLYADEDIIASKKSNKKKHRQDSDSDDDEEDYEAESCGNNEADSEGEDEEEQSEQVTKGGLRTLITDKMIKDWQLQLQGKNPEEAFRSVSSGLLAAIESINCSDDSAMAKYSVKSPAIFNALVHVSLQHMAPALLQMLHITSLAHITSSRKFKKHAPIIKTYLQNVLKLHDCITDTSLRKVILRRGVLPLIAVYKVQPKQCRQFIKKLIDIWSSGDNSTRVLAFVGIFRLIKMMDADVLDYTLKTMYFSYVQNCRFTAPSSLGSICFMRLSLSELYSLDQPLAYRHAFVYIKQMAFHLRMALITNKKDKLQLVYNWQFIHSLHLWCQLLYSTHPSTVLEPLIYPVTQLALATMNLQKSPRFFPLVLQVSSMLTDLSEGTNTFIPVLPFLTHVFSEILESKGKKKKTKDDSAEEKTPKWNCVLKLSEGEVGVVPVMKSLMQECAVQITRYLAVEANSVAFPELVVPCIVMLKKCEKNKEAFGQNLVRQLVRHISDQASLVEDRRQDVSFQLKDRKQLLDWENALKQEGKQPMVKLYDKLRSEGDGAWQQQTGNKRKASQQEDVSNKKRKLGKNTIPSFEKVKQAKEKVEKLSLADL